eukprot:SAG31_NODE_48_length_30945_cov_16.254263_2_plen_149_part_00
MGTRAQMREQAWKLYNEQLNRSIADGKEQQSYVGGGTTAKALWEVIAPAAFVVPAEEAVNDILETCNRLSPIDKQSSILSREKVLVIGVAGYGPLLPLRACLATSADTSSYYALWFHVGELLLQNRWIRQVVVVPANNRASRWCLLAT